MAAALDFTREDVAVLPTSDDDNLATAFTPAEYLEVSLANGAYVDLASVGGYAVLLLKYTGSSQVPLTVTWVGKSNRACSDSTTYLQIFNRTTTAWETLISDATTAADTPFVLTATQTSSLGDYYDGSFVISARVYQQAA